MTFKFSGSAAGLVDPLSVDSVEGHNQVSGKGFPTTGPRSEAGNVVVHKGLHVIVTCALSGIRSYLLVDPDAGCSVRAQRGADRRGAGRMREGHMDASGFLIASAMYFVRIFASTVTTIVIPRAQLMTSRRQIFLWTSFFFDYRCAHHHHQTVAKLLHCMPDIACFTKLMTGGIIPLSATLASNSVFESFIGDSKLWDDNLVYEISSHPAVKRVVALGTLFALELQADGSNVWYASLYARSLLIKLREDGI
ncbi:bifunctional dethiobiotin synthetase/7,8-diamino-pelargonic acid aminotransferase [Cucumis melo var. makuwa]|uniref:Bifunctional dethiobiotin synthetase/7,8-diamino-pelargonic acid aminotransferase n=1 Tax=Cucumis melo var. makuwa TaxID=1194695 RepID=A0A5D3BRT5_CUCMM|nr:bifunctional dethiobiotin synthetase/7,8-diamino-pelargonic acid aminotransferase [Cucumis melo var. makuwa]